MSAFLSASVDSVSGCIVKCVENVNVEKTITTNANQKPRLTTWVIMASGKPSTSMRRNWKVNSVMLGTPGACGRAFRSLLIVHTSSLQQWHSPLWQTQWRLCMVWSIKQHALTGERVLWLSGYSWCEKSRLNPQKAAGPVNILGRVPWDCATQLTGIFDISLSQAVVPSSFKKPYHHPCANKVTRDMWAMLHNCKYVVL